MSPTLSSIHEFDWNNQWQRILWPHLRPLPPDKSRIIPFSDMIAGGKLDVDDVIQPIYDEINEQYGTNEKPD